MDPGIKEHDMLCQRIEAEAIRLGFTVQPGRREGTCDPIASDLLLTRNREPQLAVEVLSFGASGDQSEDVRRCLAVRV